MKFNAKKLVAFILATAIIAVTFLAMPNEVEAATRTVNTTITNLYKSGGGLSAAVIKKTPTVKLGVNKVVQKNAKKSCYVKFVAPQTKTYTFTFSNMDVSKPNQICCGHIYISTKNGKYLDSLKGSTFGGQSHTLYLGSKRFLQNHKNTGDKLYYYMSKRSYKVTLKKGQTLFLNGYVAGPDKCTRGYTVKIS